LKIFKETSSHIGKRFATILRMERIADPTPTACKVCQGPSPLFGVIDFHKSCIEAQGRRLPFSGYAIYYRRCERCGFVFTDAFDAWTPASFHHNIYNDEYILVDPDFVEVRPSGNAKLVAQTFLGSRDTIRILDYGGGSGLLAQRLRDDGFKAETYDPFSSFNQKPESVFDLITCFEVMEHVPSPKTTVATMVSLLKAEGAILFSTLLQPSAMANVGLNWWYAGPRNGHISLYTSAALSHLFNAHGINVASFSENLHIAYRQVPQFAAHLNLPRRSSSVESTA